MRKIFYFLPLLFLFSCIKSSVYSEMYRGFDDNRWMKSDSHTFDFEIEEDAKASIILDFSGYNEVPIVVSILKPTGEEEVVTANLLLKDEKGKDISNCTGDICDLEFTLKEVYSFTKGKYRITVANDFNHTFLPNVLGVGIDIRIPE